MRRIGFFVLCVAYAHCGLIAQLKDPVPDENGIFVMQSGVARPNIVHAAPAAYPDDPRLAQTRHTCVVSVVVGPDGSIESVDLENANPSAFDRNALAAVRASTFSPGTVKGHSVAVRTEVWVVFRGGGKAALPATSHVGSFQNPKPRYDPDAKFTKAARKAMVTGDLLVSFVVTEDGNTSDVRAINRLGSGLDEEAVETVRKWRFAPATLDGEAVPNRISTVVSFRLY